MPCPCVGYKGKWEPHKSNVVVSLHLVSFVPSNRHGQIPIIQCRSNWPCMSENGEVLMTQAVVFGLGSMFNHSRDQNVGWERDVEKQVVTYIALRAIKAGEELCKWTWEWFIWFGHCLDLGKKVYRMAQDWLSKILNLLRYKKRRTVKMSWVEYKLIKLFGNGNDRF